LNPAFTGRLIVRGLSPYEVIGKGSDVALWELMEDFSFNSALLNCTITVPKGLITDFASIPRLIWDHLSPDDPIILFPSVIHDFLYTTGGVVSPSLTITREQADAVLREAMEVCGAGSFIRNAVYQAVEEFGGAHWPIPKQK
jgi:hypothetical protein